MKTFLVASLFAISSSVMAMPAIGDIAVYSGDVNGMPVTMKSELTSFDTNKSTWTRVNTTTVMGQAQTDTEELALDEVLSEETLTAVVTYCETEYIKGVSETVTVAAGTFETCAITDAETGNIVNLGLVPFGVVKMTGNGMAMELSSYVLGQ